MIHATLRFGRNARLLVLAWLGLMAGHLAMADEPAVQPRQVEGQIMPTPDYNGTVMERSTLTGNWGGSRQDLANHGITFDGYLTQVTQGVVSGGLDTGWEYLGRGQFELNIDTTKARLWPGGLLSVIGEGHFGHSMAQHTGTLFPVDVNESFPETPNSFVIPQVAYTQFLSEKLAVYFGKLTTITSTSGDMNEFAHGKGDRGFLNMAFCFNPAMVLTTPYSTWGAGTLFIPIKDLQIAFTLLDPHGAANSAQFDSMFSDGVTFSLEGRYTTRLFDKTGHHLLGGAYSTSHYTDLDQRAINLIIPRLPIQQASYSWCVYYNADQYFYQPQSDVDRGVGLFGRVGFSDGVANPIEAFASAGIGGKGMIPGRGDDRFGIGYYYSFAADTRIVNRLGFGDAQGVEAFYEFAITPWALLTPDIQWVQPSSRNVDPSWITGLRLTLVF